MRSPSGCSALPTSLSESVPLRLVSHRSKAARSAADWMVLPPLDGCGGASPRPLVTITDGGAA